MTTGCIFCKRTNVAFTSVEHIVPESLGNTEHILPRGVVCDSCNNYFARKIEGPILGSNYFRQARHRNGIPSKRRRIPTLPVLSFSDGIALELGVCPEGTRYINATDQMQNERFVSLLRQSGELLTIHPVAEPPDEVLFSRFLLVMGLEALALRMLAIPGGIENDHLRNQSLDEARTFARYGIGLGQWPFHTTRLYIEGSQFLDEKNGVFYDVPHEYMLLRTDSMEVYFVIAIFGVQYTINLGGPEMEGFLAWLKQHENRSLLYFD